MAAGDSPIQVGVNCQLCPVLSDVALRISVGALLLRRIRTEVLYRERRTKWVREMVLAAEGRS